LPAGTDAKLSMPLYADSILPLGLKGLFFVGIIATIMSTIDSYCLVGGMTISHDIYHKVLKKTADQAKLIKVSRIGVVITCLLAMILSLSYNASIKTIWYVVGSITFSALFFPTLAGMFIVKDGKSSGGLPSMIFGVFGAVVWFILQKAGIVESWGKLFSILEPLYIGLLFSAGAFFIFHKKIKESGHA